MKFAPLTRLLRYEFRRFKGLSALALVFILLIPIRGEVDAAVKDWNQQNKDEGERGQPLESAEFIT